MRLLRLALSTLVLWCLAGQALALTTPADLVSTIWVRKAGTTQWVQAWPEQRRYTSDGLMLCEGAAFVLAADEIADLEVKGRVYDGVSLKLKGKSLAVTSGDFGPLPLDSIEGAEVRFYTLEAQTTGKKQEVTFKVISGWWETAPLPKATVTIGYPGALPSGWKPGLDPLTVEVDTPDPLDPLASRWTASVFRTEHGSFGALYPLTGGQGRWLAQKPKPVKPGPNGELRPFYPDGGSAGLVNNSGTQGCIGNSQVTQDLSSPWFEPIGQLPSGSLTLLPSGSYELFVATKALPFEPLEGRPSYPSYEVYLGRNGLLIPTSVASGIGAWELRACPNSKFVVANRISTYAEDTTRNYLIEGDSLRELSGAEEGEALYGSLAAEALAHALSRADESLSFNFATNGDTGLVLVCAGDAGRYLVHAPGGTAAQSATASQATGEQPQQVRVQLACEPALLPTPVAKGASAQAQLTVSVTDTSGKPQAGVLVEVALSKSCPWANLSTGTVTTNAAGQAPVTVEIRDDFATVDLTQGVPSATFHAGPMGDYEGPDASLTVPLNAAVLVGTYVDADMQPRALNILPETLPKTRLLGSKLAEEKFLLLISLAQRFATSDLKLKWDDSAPCPLNYTVLKPFAAGETCDLGLFDLLSPDEHQQRLRKWLLEFANSMPLTAKGREMLTSQISAVRFESGGPEGSVPHFADGLIGSDVIKLPGAEGQWYASDPNDLENDPAYTILFHEAGHLVHHSLIERHYYLSIVYNSLVGHTHNTWSIPMADPADIGWRIEYSGTTSSARRYTAFAESTADLFAYLMHTFWLARHPECKDSLYNRRGYLVDFDDDTKADQALQGAHPGQQIEGVCTRFLLSLYGGRSQSAPAQVYADYLATMLQYRRECYVYKRAARTLEEWVQSRKDYGTPVHVPNAVDLEALAKRYRLFEDSAATPAKPVVSPLSAPEGPPGTLLMGNQPVEFVDRGVNLVKPGTVLVAEQGDFLLAWPAADGKPKQAILKQGTQVTVPGSSTLILEKGRLAAEGALVLSAAGCTVSPQGTAFVAEVTPQGALQVTTVEGSLAIQTTEAQAPRLLEAHEGLAVSAAGELTPLSSAQQAPLLADLPDPGDTLELLFVSAAPTTVATGPASDTGAASASEYNSDGWVDLTDAAPLVRLALCRSVDLDQAPQGSAWKFPSTIQELLFLFELRGMTGPVRFQIDLTYEGNSRTRLSGNLSADGIFMVHIVPQEIPRFPSGDYVIKVKLDDWGVFEHDIKVY